GDEAAVRIRLRKLGGQVAADDVELGLRGGAGGTRLETRPDVDSGVRLAQAHEWSSVLRDWRQDVRAPHVEGCRGNADDRVRCRFEGERRANGRRRAAKAALPQRLTDHSAR